MALDVVSCAGPAGPSAFGFDFKTTGTFMSLISTTALTTIRLNVPTEKK
jgi:hypothetical protein